ncbi:MAG: hypothetical protein RLP09_18345 [Sandaracinaceae bacterium]
MRCAWLAFALTAACLSLGAQPVAAQDGVVVGDFAGPRARLVRRQVVRAVSGSSLRVVPQRRAEAEAAGRELGEAEVLEALDARALVTGRVGRVGRRWAAEVRVTDRAGEVVLEERFASRRFGGLGREVRRWAASDMVPALEAIAVAPAVVAVEPVVFETPPEPETREASPEASPQAEPSDRPAPLAFTAGFAVTHRSFTYNDDLFFVLRPYVLPAAPVVRLGVEYFPGVHLDASPLDGLSVVTTADFAVAVHSVADNGASYPTDNWSLGLGARYRLRVDDVAFHVDAGYQAYVFTIQDADELTPRPEIPNIEIHAARAGAGFRWDIGLGLFFAGSGAYLHPFTGGELTSEAWFPRATGGGVDLDAGMGLQIDDVTIRAMASYRRFFWAMNPEPGDARVAGGAVDEYASAVVDLTFAPR